MRLPDHFTPGEMARLDQGHAMWLGILRDIAIGVREKLAEGASTAEASFMLAFALSRSDFRHHHLAALAASSIVERIVNEQGGINP